MSQPATEIKRYVAPHLRSKLNAQLVPHPETSASVTRSPDNLQPAVHATSHDADTQHSAVPNIDPSFGSVQRLDRLVVAERSSDNLPTSNSHAKLSAVCKDQACSLTQDTAPDQAGSDTVKASSPPAFSSEWDNLHDNDDHIQHEPEPIADSDHELRDYTGGWAPAPADWDARPAFVPEVRKINEWLKYATPLTPCSFTFEVVNARGKTRYCFASSAAPSTDFTIMSMGEIVPRRWIPQTMEARRSPGEFWQYHKQCPPNPLGDDTLDDIEPWWNCYADPKAHFFLDAVHPHCIGIDQSEETKRETQARKRNRTSQSAIEQKIRSLQPADQESPAPPQVSEIASELAPATTAPPRSDNKSSRDYGIRPLVQMYLRSAKLSDAPKLTRLYNTLAATSVACAETEAVTEDEVKTHLRAVQTYSLPYIVAVAGVAHIGSNAKKDQIIGMGYANQFADIRAMYRFTAQLEFFVHPDYTRKNIANCIIDQLLFMLDCGHVPRRGYDVEGDEMTLGTTRILSKLIISVPFVSGTSERMRWLWNWLQGPNAGFKQIGTVDDVGMKLGHSVSLAQFSRKTGTVLNPKNLPFSMR